MKKIIDNQSKKQLWACIHWTGSIDAIGKEKEMKARAKRSSFNPKAPIYYAAPIYGISQGKCDKCKGKGYTLEASHPTK